MVAQLVEACAASRQQQDCMQIETFCILWCCLLQNTRYASSSFVTGDVNDVTLGKAITWFFVIVGQCVTDVSVWFSEHFIFVVRWCNP